MEHRSIWDNEDIVLKFSDDDCSNAMDHTDKYEDIEHIWWDDKICKSSQLKLDCSQLKQVNSYEFNDVKHNQIAKRKNHVFTDEEEKQKFLSHYLTSTRGSPEKQQEKSQSHQNDSISDKMVNFSKLINQLLNARVVIERMCENFATNEQSTKKCALSNGSRFKDCVQRYCPKCQTVTVDTHEVSLKKSCSKCESTLNYLCSECNIKHYSSIHGLKNHWKSCTMPDSTLKMLKPANFLVRKTKIDFSMEIIRNCPTCNEVVKSGGKWIKKVCRNCNQCLLFQCNKCKAQYNTYDSLVHHMYRRCYTSRYKCNKCDVTSSTWDDMRRHVINVHLQVLTSESDNSRLKPIVTDKNGTKLFLDKSQFTVQKFDSVSMAEKWKRHCRKCGVVTASHNDRRCKCGESLFFTCTKCHRMYHCYQSLWSHLESRCFPIAQYRCTRCEYSTMSWAKLHTHFKFMHTDQPSLKCKLCSYETKYKQDLKLHEKRVHCKISGKFVCSSCSYSTNFERNLHRHEKLTH